MFSILALAALAAPQDAGLDPVPFRPEASGGGQLVEMAPADEGAFLGVGLAPDAARVTQVVANSAALSAGLEVGDVILKIGERAIASSKDVIDAVAEHEAGDSIRIVFARGDAKHEADVVLGARPAQRRILERSSDGGGGAAERGRGPSAEERELLEGLGYLTMPPPAPRPDEPGWLGLSIGGSEDGVEILEVTEGGPAARSGLRAGETIIRIDDIAVTDVDGLVAELEKMRPGRRVIVGLRGDDGERTVRVRLGARPDAGAGGAGAESRPDTRPGIGQQEERDIDREAIRAARQRFAEELGTMRQRHADEERALRERFAKEFESLGVNPRRALNAGGLLELRPGEGMLFGDGGGGGNLLFRGLPDGAGGIGGVDVEMAPMIQQLLEGAEQGGAFPRALRERILEDISEAHPRAGMPQRGGGSATENGMQQEIEISIGPDGHRIEKRRIGRLVDGQWQWTEEIVEHERTEGRTDGIGRRGRPDAGSDLDRQIDELRRELDRLQRRHEELLKDLDR